MASVMGFSVGLSMWHLLWDLVCGMCYGIECVPSVMGFSVWHLLWDLVCGMCYGI